MIGAIASGSIGAGPLLLGGNQTPGLSGAASVAAAATGALSTGIKLGGAANAATTAAAALTNWATVTLAGTLYTGVGGIFDPNLVWPYTTPGVGSVIYYDPTYVTIEPNGEIVSTVNNCTFVMQYYDGTNWNIVVVVVTPSMVGYADVGEFLTGALSTAIQMVSGAAALVSAVGALSTAIKLAGTASDVTSATAALSTQIKMAGNAIAVATASGNFQAGSAALAGSAQVSTNAAGAIGTAIQLLSSAVALASAAGTLATQILATASALATTQASGSLTTGIHLSGAATDATAASASLLTQIRISSAASDLTTSAAALTAQIEFLGTAAAQATASGQMTTLHPLQGAAADVSTATASLSTLVEMSGTAWVNVAASGGLATTIILAPEVVATTLATGRLYTVPTISPPSSLSDIRVVYAQCQGIPRYNQLGDLPFGEFFQAAGEMIWYGINWNEWLASHWQPDTSVSVGQSIRSWPSNGFQNTCTAAGRTGSKPPLWLPYIGASVLDGSVTWVTGPVDDTSLGATVVSASWNANDELVLSSGGVRDQTALVLIDTTAAVPGADYDVACTTTMSDGQVNIGKIRIKVR